MYPNVELSTQRLRAAGLSMRLTVALAAMVWVACGSPPSASVDAAADALAADASDIMVDDGPAMRRPCTNQFGTKLTKTFGRLDGILVAIVDPGARNCNGDSDHVHLQILAKGEVYDIAINVDGRAAVSTATATLPLTGRPWTDGWSTGYALDYAAMGVNAGTFKDMSKAELVAAIKADLANVNHISVYAVGYGPDGAHLVHRNGFGNDGAVVTQPLSRPAKWRMFRFADQSF